MLALMGGRPWVCAECVCVWSQMITEGQVLESWPV